MDFTTYFSIKLVTAIALNALINQKKHFAKDLLNFFRCQKKIVSKCVCECCSLLVCLHSMPFNSY